MADHSPELAAFAASLNAHPEDVDLLIIKGYQNRTLITKLRPHAPRIQELLEIMWTHEKG